MHFQWLKNKNTKFFHRLASARIRGNRISFLMDQDSITKPTIDFFVDLYTKEDWSRPSLDNLAFASIGEERAAWLEKVLRKRK